MTITVMTFSVIAQRYCYVHFLAARSTFGEIANPNQCMNIIPCLSTCDVRKAQASLQGRSKPRCQACSPVRLHQQYAEIVAMGMLIVRLHDSTSARGDLPVTGGFYIEKQALSRCRLKSFREKDLTLQEVQMTQPYSTLLRNAYVGMTLMIMRMTFSQVRYHFNKKSYFIKHILVQMKQQMKTWLLLVILLQSQLDSWLGGWWWWW